MQWAKYAHILWHRYAQENESFHGKPSECFTSQAHQLSICTDIGNPAHPVWQPSGKNCQCENFRATRIPNKVRQGVKTKEQASWLFHETTLLLSSFFAQFRMWCSHQDIQQHTIKYIVGNGSSADTISIYELALAYACKLNEPNSLQWISNQPTKSCANESCTSSSSLMYVRDRNRERQSVSVTSDYWITNGKYNNYSENL